METILKHCDNINCLFNESDGNIDDKTGRCRLKEIHIEKFGTCSSLKIAEFQLQYRKEQKSLS